jgi:hypothetical protein
MPTTPTIEPTNPPSAGRVVDPRSSPGRRHPVRSAASRLLGVLRGDKYMVNAYPPAWRPPGAATAVQADGGIAAGVRSGTSQVPADPRRGASTPPLRER